MVEVDLHVATKSSWLKILFNEELLVVQPLNTSCFELYSILETDLFIVHLVWGM